GPPHAIAMKSPTRRPIALVLLLALNGIAILCGPALHRHDRRAGLSWGNKSKERVPSDHAGSSHADCPVCHFLAQGQLGTDRVRIDRSECAVGGVQVLETREASPQLACTSRPRAPPQV
ncbi:MAG TPA: hypothetical protein VGI06_10895, partial [Acidimicrobiales bacterium]